MLAILETGSILENLTSFYQIAARATIVFLIGLAIVRLGKSRLIARSTPGLYRT